jgi:hypothetical protein
MIQKNSSEFVSPKYALQLQHQPLNRVGTFDITAPKFIYRNIQKFLKYHSDVSEHSGFSELNNKTIQKNIQKYTLEPQSSLPRPVIIRK